MPHTIPSSEEFQELKDMLHAMQVRIELLEEELSALDWLTLSQAGIMMKIKTNDIISKMIDCGELEGRAGIGKSRQVSRRSVIEHMKKKKLKHQKR